MKDQFWKTIKCTSVGKIYEGMFPTLSDISLEDYSENLLFKDCSLTLLTQELPKKFPRKWSERGNNAISIMLGLRNVCYKSHLASNITASRFYHLCLDVEESEGFHVVKLLDINRQCILLLECTSVDVIDISGVTV